MLRIWVKSIFDLHKYLIIINISVGSICFYFRFYPTNRKKAVLHRAEWLFRLKSLRYELALFEILVKFYDSLDAFTENIDVEVFVGRVNSVVFKPEAH